MSSEEREKIICAGSFFFHFSMNRKIKSLNEHEKSVCVFECIKRKKDRQADEECIHTLIINFHSHEMVKKFNVAERMRFYFIKKNMEVNVNV